MLTKAAFIWLKTAISRNITILNIYSNIFSNVIYCCDAKLNFSIITPVFSVTWSFRNHSYILIWCSRNISYYQCWKQLCCFILWKPWYVLMLWSTVKFKITALIWNRNCNIIIVFTVTFDQHNISWLNKSNNFFTKKEKKKKLTDPQLFNSIV